MDNSERILKSIDAMEKAFTGGIKDTSGAKRDIINSLGTYLALSKIAMLEKHLTRDMFTKPISAPAKAITGPAVAAGKKVGGIASKIGRAISGYGKKVGEAAKTGAKTWTEAPSTVPKPAVVSAKVAAPEAKLKRHVKISPSGKGPVSDTNVPKPAAKKTAPPVKTKAATFTIRQKPTVAKVPEAQAKKVIVPAKVKAPAVESPSLAQAPEDITASLTKNVKAGDVTFPTRVADKTKLSPVERFDSTMRGLHERMTGGRTEGYSEPRKTPKLPS